MPRLSIVIPAKNEERLLPRLLQSIREQTLTDYEIIVADAKSTDQTRRIAASYGAQVVQGGMPGPGRNRGAEAATGKYVVFFDADVILPSEYFLEDCLAEMEERGLELTTCRVLALEGTTVDRAMHGVYNAFTVATERLLPHAPGFCLFADRRAHEAIRGFDEDVVFAEDHDYVRRAAKLGYRFGILRKHKLPVSVRRMEKEGRMMLAVKYIYAELHMVTLGSFKHRMPFEYEFDAFDKASSGRKERV